jgi:hypothetical protein
VLRSRLGIRVMRIQVFTEPRAQRRQPVVRSLPASAMLRRGGSINGRFIR